MTPDRTALPKVTRRLLPFLFVLYVVCFLDRVNLGFAALQMNRQLGLTAAEYGFGAGIFFLGYVLFEVPSNLILARVGARRWIARIMISWGLVAAGMMFIRGSLSLYVLRFLLGATEAGFFPGIVYYLSRWYPAAERARAIARFMVAIPVSGIVGGPISGALLGLNGQLGLAGWQWLFLLEGLPAVLLGFVVLTRLTDGPEQAAWLTRGEREWLSARLSEERTDCERRHGIGVVGALTNGTVWQLGALILLCNAFGVYVLGLWLPQIVRSLGGLSDLAVGIVTAVPNLVAAVAMVVVAAHSDRTGERLLHIAAVATIAAIGFVASALLHSPALVVLALSLAAAGALASHGPFWTLPSQFLTDSAAAGGLALIVSIANLAGFAGPYIMGILRGSSGSFRSGLLAVGVVTFAGALLAVRLRRAPVLAGAGR